MTENSHLSKLLNTLPQIGRVDWIGVRPARNQSMILLEHASLEKGKGIEGDRFSGNRDNARQVTLIQSEHLTAIGLFLNRDAIPAEILRRNIAVSGLNLLALKGKQFCIDEVILEYSGQCHPCSKMERSLGPGGYNAMRGHGGITARVIRSGLIRLGSSIKNYDQAHIHETVRN
ncbi:MAG: MOSC domain-containing protein [Pseudomonadota bacterium]